MTWGEAEINLRENIVINDHLAGFGHYKIVVNTPPYTFNKVDEAFKIKVGKNSYINISLLMLQLLFEESLTNNNIYNRNVFKKIYPHEYEVKPCYVHSVGKLFVKANIAVQLNSRNYRIL
ncbi:hypothetical protein [Flavobacterium helocola]|uniref:Site-specific DNA-methyltransferase (adenine-specific) n=1 Tax=Flavobacterium helocola TaxID=3139139 RepID=A0ABU9I9D7_9FLAO